MKTVKLLLIIVALAATLAAVLLIWLEPQTMSETEAKFTTTLFMFIALTATSECAKINNRS